jgi:hypothetical protein
MINSGAFGAFTSHSQFYQPWGSTKTEKVCGSVLPSARRGAASAEARPLPGGAAGRDGRCAIPELEMEVGLLDGLVRFWYQGKLLPLPADLQRELDELHRRLKKAEQRAEQGQKRAEQETQRTDALEREVEKLRKRLGTSG